MAQDARYDPTDLGEEISQVRFLIGDTSSPFQLSDPEIQYLLDVGGSPIQAAIGAVRALIAKVTSSGGVTKRVGDLQIGSGDRVDHYRLLLQELENQAAVNDPATIYVGGQSRDEDLSDRRDSDLPPPRFVIGQDDFQEFDRNLDRNQLTDPSP